MNSYQYKHLTVEVIDEPAYKFGSSDNTFSYTKHYFGDSATEFPTSKHGVKIAQDNKIINSCIVIGSGGATGVHQNSSLIDNDKLLLCCCDTIFCLTLPDLHLKWKTKADTATCFQIFQLRDDYIVHGELQVTRLDRDGNKKWTFGGADIFVAWMANQNSKLNLTEFYLLILQRQNIRSTLTENYFGTHIKVD